MPTTLIPFLIDLATMAMFSLTVGFAILAVEHQNIMYAVLFFLGVNILLGIIYYVAGAPFVSAFQIAVFAGAIIVFFIVTVILTRGGEWR